MRAVVNHEKYGEIVYKESFWTGRKNLSINGNALKCESKNMFSYDNGESKIIVTVFGNFVKGAKVKINDEKIQIVPNIKWYEVALGVIMFAFFIVWGNVPQLCAMFPIVGGAIGGFVSALFGIGGVVTMKFMKKIWMKLVVWVVCFGAALGINYGLAIAILTILV